MKKLFTLALAAMLTMTASADKKRWDFTSWGTKTVANLIAGSDWSDIEKADGTAPTEYSKENCFWEVSARGTADGETLTANGETIAELDGLLYTNTAARSLAIALNYPDATPVSGADFGPYHGPSYLWLGSKKRNYFIIPNVKAGSTIKIGLESHKFSNARGVELYIGHGTSGTKLKDPNGEEVAPPKTYEDQTWKVPAADEITDAANADGTYDIQIYNTDGCHLYYIEVSDDAIAAAKEVALVTTNANDFTVELLPAMGYNYTTVLLANATAEQLKSFDAVVVSPFISHTADVKAVKEAIAFVPVLNLNPNLLSFGYTKTVNTNVTTATVVDAGSPLFENVNVANGFAMLLSGGITGVELDNYFASDDIIAKAGDVVAIHIHNKSRNAYLMVPYTVEAFQTANENAFQVIENALAMVAGTKRAVKALGNPIISTKATDGKVTVTITCGDATAIYYTIDGTDPTTDSPVYTAPFELTQNATVKAFAIGDGYTPSGIATSTITVKSMAQQPKINIQREQGKSIVSFTASEGTDVYFNFTGSTNVSESEKYDAAAPIELTEPAHIYYFATGETVLPSWQGKSFVGINGIDNNNIRWDVIAHMDGSKAEWSEVGSEESRSAKVNYMFGKNAQSCYTDEVIGQETVKDSQGNDSIVYHYKMTPAQEVLNVSGTWKAVSHGQVVTWESDGVQPAVGTAGRNPEKAIDVMPVNETNTITNQFLNFKGKVSGEPYNASIETVEPLQGPFDVVVYLCNGDKSGNYPKVNLEYSKDGSEWVKIDTLATHDQRFIKRSRLSYEGTDKVYIRLAHIGGGAAGQVFNIYVLNNGEQSKLYDEKALIAADETAISENTTKAELVRTEVYTLGGNRSGRTTRGINIVRKVYSDGTIETHKVMVK